MKNLILTLLAVCMIAGFVIGSTPGDKQVIVKIIAPDDVWVDSHLSDKLKQRLSRRSDLRILWPDQLGETTPAFPDDYHNLDSLANWGSEVGGRYLLLIDITAQYLERRKSFHLPLIFHKYENFGVCEGELRLLDLNRSKMLTAEPFKIELNGPRVFQATMDDDKGDPDLHLSATDKILFFSKLEDKVCEHITKKTTRYLRRNYK